MFKINCFVLAVVVCLCLTTAGFEKASASDEGLNPEKVVAEHLKSIAKPELLAGIKSRVLTGVSSVEFVQGARGNQTGGQFLFASDGPRLGMVLKYGAVDYPGEYFAYDGSEVTVGYISPGQRSPLADFIFRYNSFVKEGLLGGVLSVSWPLLDIQKSHPVLKYKEAKVEGVQLHMLEYSPKKSSGDLKVRLYFDWENFHHVRTEYSLRVKNDLTALPSITGSSAPTNIGGQPSSQRSIDGSARPTIMEGQAESVYTLIERFDMFREVGGVTLPFSYNIEYSIVGQGASFLARWAIRSDGKFTNNAQIGTEFFRAQK